MNKTAIRKVLFFFRRPYHIPILLPVFLHWKHLSSDIEFAFFSPRRHKRTLTDREDDGLENRHIQRLQKVGLKKIHDPFQFNPCVTLNADNNYRFVEGLGFIVNLSHGTISKGLYFLKKGFSIRENIADLLCVPGNIHKAYLKHCVYKPIQVTGMPKLDALMKAVHPHTAQIPPRVLLIAPTFNKELSVWPCLLEHDPKDLFPTNWKVIIKLHDFMTGDIREKFRQWAAKHTHIVLSACDNISDHFHESHVLLTDVSSVAYEFLITQKPIILFNSNMLTHYDYFDKDHIEYKYRRMGHVLKDLRALKSLLVKYGKQKMRATKKHQIAQTFLKIPDESASSQVVRSIQTHYRPLQEHLLVCVNAVNQNVTEKLWKQIGSRFKVAVFTDKAIKIPPWIQNVKIVPVSKTTDIDVQSVCGARDTLIAWVQGRFLYSDHFFDLGIGHFKRSPHLKELLSFKAVEAVLEPFHVEFLSSLNYWVCGQSTKIAMRQQAHDVVFYRRDKHTVFSVNASGELNSHKANRKFICAGFDMLAIQYTRESRNLKDSSHTSLPMQWLTLNLEEPFLQKQLHFFGAWMQCRGIKHRLHKIKYWLDVVSALINVSALREAEVYLEKIGRLLKNADAKLYQMRYHYHMARLFEKKALNRKAIEAYLHVLTFEPLHHEAKRRLNTLKETLS